MFNGKPVAILGDGHCLRDIHDPEALYEERYCIGLNNAISRVRCHALFVHTMNAWLMVNQHMRRGMKIIVGHPLQKHVKDWNPKEIQTDFLAHWDDKIVWRAKSIVDKSPLPFDAVLPSALAFLGEHGILDVEIYGVDMNLPTYKTHTDWCRLVVDGYKMNLINCCPSSQWGYLPLEERPWTNKVETCPHCGQRMPTCSMV